MIDRIRVRMLETVNSLFAGEALNLPIPLAEMLIAAGQAESLEPKPRENKAVAPPENKSRYAVSGLATADTLDKITQAISQSAEKNKRPRK